MTQPDRQGDLGPAGPPVAVPATRTEVALRDFAGVLSAIVPGTGHFLLRQFWRGGAWLALALAASFLWWGLRLPHVLGGLALALFAIIAVWVLSGLDALFGFRRVLPRAKSGWLLLVIPVAVCFGAIASNLLLRVSGFNAFEQPSNAMEATVMANETVVTDTRAYRSAHPKVGDVVVFVHADKPFLRRIIAIGPAKVQGHDGDILVNGTPLPEPYARHSGPKMPNLDNFGPVDVAPEEYFVAGDNRDSALDSRMPDFGLATSQAVTGKALYILRTLNPIREGRAVR